MPHLAQIILLTGAFAAGSGADAATLTTRLTGKGTMIVLKGDIAREDSESLARLIQAAHEEGHIIRGLQLDSPGGSLLGGVNLARFIRDHADLSATVASGATCASACFVVFAAGHEKFAAFDSFVGVHGVADRSGQMTGETEAATLAMAGLCRDLGVPASITEKLIATPADEIVWLSSEDLRSMGTTMIGRPVQSPKARQRETAPGRQDQQASELRVGPLSKPQSDLVKLALAAAKEANYTTAIKLWRILAAQGHAPSQYNLGQMYYAGQSVPQDFTEAVKWYEKAADKGVANAQLSLGLAYALGRGLRQDLPKAYKWLKLATESFADGHDREQALKAHALIAARMTPDEVAEAEKETRDWTRSP
ncbi:SEL1-like repeat protein [Methyloferula stellata]|uniref:SEL1-like repeat protein n=1 Tax=Methyloferula stellata TaxID=876270 RepID=UPI0003798116|nr:SEL1-like repeat protein [Methyloferula stellata]